MSSRLHWSSLWAALRLSARSQVSSPHRGTAFGEQVEVVRSERESFPVQESSVVRKSRVGLHQVKALAQLRYYAPPAGVA